MTNHLDIEEIEHKLSKKRINKDISAISDKKHHAVEEKEIKYKLKIFLNQEDEKVKNFTDNEKIEMKKETVISDSKANKLQQKIEMERLEKKEEKSKAKILAKEQRLEEKRQKIEEKRIAEEQRLEEKRQRIEENQERLEEKRIVQEQRKIRAVEERVERAESKKVLEEEAALKRREQALKGMKYLLSISEKYSDFYKEKLSTDIKPVKQ